MRVLQRGLQGPVSPGGLLRSGRHGAVADASSWNEVIERLQGRGL